MTHGQTKTTYFTREAQTVDWQTGKKPLNQLVHSYMVNAIIRFRLNMVAGINKEVFGMLYMKFTTTPCLVSRVRFI